MNALVVAAGLVAGALLGSTAGHAQEKPKDPGQVYAQCLGGCAGSYANDMAFCATGIYAPQWYAGCVGWAFNKRSWCERGCSGAWN